jgi:hypothetical protein
VLREDIREQPAADDAARPLETAAVYVRRTLLPRVIVECLIFASALDGFGRRRRCSESSTRHARRSTSWGYPLGLQRQEEAVSGFRRPQAFVALRALLRQEGLWSSRALHRGEKGVTAQTAGILVVRQPRPPPRATRFSPPRTSTA